jgi:hypothetical protein
MHFRLKSWRYLGRGRDLYEEGFQEALSLGVENI